MSDSYAARLAALRDELGLSQDQFAARIGIPKRTLQDIENGKVERPQRKTRAKIDAVLSLARGADKEGADTRDVDTFLELLEVYLYALPEGDRTDFIHETIRRMAR